MTTAKYIGRRFPSGCRVHRVSDEGKYELLPLRLDLLNHSPTGFEWGYAGSGPAQLALAMLADALSDDARAVRLHQHFKRDFVQNIDQDVVDWTHDAGEVRRWATTVASFVEGDQ